MTYNELKKKMNFAIDIYIQDNDNPDINDLYFLIDTRFGLGKLSVDRRLKLLDNGGFIEFTNGKITKPKKEDNDDKTNNNNNT